MAIARTLFYCSDFAPIRYCLPKGVRNRIYSNFIRSLASQAIETSRAHDIYATNPIICVPESSLKLWMVTSKKDLLMAFWCLKTLMVFSGETWDVWIADGGLDSESTDLLTAHFPGARILKKSALTERTSVALREYPLSNWLRHERDFALSIKLFDPLLHIASHRFLLLDSDILFFQRPAEILAELKNERQLTGHAFNLELGNINSGLAVIDPSIITLEEIERHLAAMTEQQRWGWPIEQDIYTLLAQGRYRGLSADYAVQPISDDRHETCTACHYIGVVRHKFFSKGVPRLRGMGFPNSLRVNSLDPHQWQCAMQAPR